MGERVNVIFWQPEHDGQEVNVYLHWGGRNAIDLLRQFAPMMRKGHLSYAAARFIGQCHDADEGGRGPSLGVSPLNGAPRGDYPALWVNCATGDVSKFSRDPDAIIETIPMGVF